ncbi:MAG: hypothetical protein ACRCY8_16020 [Dermatophilaceae bacterium]
MRRSVSMVARLAAGVAVATAGLVTAPATQAAVETGGTDLFDRPGYDYAPSVIQEGDVRRIWWCGQTTTSDGFATDAIFYAEQDVATGELTPPQQVLTPSPSAVTWDRSYICDPSVIRGEFVNPDDGQSYTYALYYTATDRGPGTSYAGTPLDGTNNRIGIAYSDDGRTWVRDSANPVISPQISPTDAYGAGQASTYSADGRAGITVTYHDNSVAEGTNIWRRTSTDGRSFSAPEPVSAAGLDVTGDLAKSSNLDIAFDSVNRYWYGAWPLPGRTGDRDTYRLVVARMPEASFPSGTWEKLGFIDSNETGGHLNHSPGLVRDGFGNVDPTLPDVELLFASGGNQPDSWNLRRAVWQPTPTTKALSRYYDRSADLHQVTTGAARPGMSLEAPLGYLSQAPTDGTVPLYSCRSGSVDHFVSLRADCEGQTALGVNGYLHTSAPMGMSTAPIYRCRTAEGHLVSLQSDCEGLVVESTLGWIRTQP